MTREHWLMVLGIFCLPFVSIVIPLATVITLPLGLWLCVKLWRS